MLPPSAHQRVSGSPSMAEAISLPPCTLDAVAFLPSARFSGTGPFGAAAACAFLVKPSPAAGAPSIITCLGGVRGASSSLSSDQGKPRVTRSRYLGSLTVSLLCPSVVEKTLALL